MSDPNEQPRELSDDLELGVQHAAKAVGGDVKPTTPQKPVQYMVYGLNDCMISGPSVAP